MPQYEFTCTACGLVKTFDRTDPVDGHETLFVEQECGCDCHRFPGVSHCVPCCYPGRVEWCFGKWKRNWSFSVVWDPADRGH